MINASAGRIYIPVPRRYKVLVPPAAVNMPTANAQALINPVPAGRLSAPHPASGTEQLNIRPAKAVVPVLINIHVPGLINRLRGVDVTESMIVVPVLLLIYGAMGVVLVQLLINMPALIVLPAIFQAVPEKVVTENINYAVV